jgi:hypothetical protein
MSTIIDSKVILSDDEQKMFEAVRVLSQITAMQLFNKTAKIIEEYLNSHDNKANFNNLLSVAMTPAYIVFIDLFENTFNIYKESIVTNSVPVKFILKQDLFNQHISIMTKILKLEFPTETEIITSPITSRTTH